MKLKVPSSLVNTNWLNENLTNKNLVILDATISKIGAEATHNKIKQQLPNAVFFDLKNVFLDKSAEFPNTIPSQDSFQDEVRKLGVNNDSCIVVYDDFGVYSSPRVWWLFKVFGFDNIAVLNGGLNNWLQNGFSVETPKTRKVKEGNFVANFHKKMFVTTNEVVKAIDENKIILDARSKERFNATVPEPRADLRGGHIPNSKSLPYSTLQDNGKMKSVEELRELFSEINKNNEEMIFTCGSGITACILALGADVVSYKNYKVYDGSWTEWASKLELPIEN